MFKIRGTNLQYTASISASILTACGGFAVMWPSPILPTLMSGNSPIGQTITKNEASLVASFLMFGSVFGNIILGPSIDYFGRKKTLQIASIPMFICWLLIIFANSVNILYISRFIMGFFQSAPMAITTVYIGEISDVKIRGKLSLISVLILETANTLTIILGSYVSYTILSTIAATLPVLFFVTFYFVPESPYFYVKKKDYEKAEYTLHKFRNSKNVTEELNKIKEIVIQNSSNNNKNSLIDLFKNKNYRHGLFIILGVKTLQQLSGTVAIQSYMKMIFDEAKTGLDSNESSMISISIALPSILLAAYLIDKIGRKLLFYISILGTMSALLLETIYFYLQSNNNTNLKQFSWMPVAGIFAFYFFRAMGISSIPYLVLGELFPPNVKGTATSVTLVYASTLASCVSYGFPMFSDYFGLGTSFLTFTIFCFVGFWFVLFFVPETKGKMLADIKFQNKI